LNENLFHDEGSEVMQKGCWEVGQNEFSISSDGYD